MTNPFSALWTDGVDLASHLVQDAIDLANATGLNATASLLASIPSAVFNNTTLSLPSFLTDTTAIPVPSGQNLSETPTVSQFLNASNSLYAIAGNPEGMSPFKVGGKQLAITDEASGMVAKVWETDKHQVIIAFQGTTGGDNILSNPANLVSGVGADVQIWDQSVSQSQKDALAFTHYVVDQAQKQGISTNNIFVTGDSLGGIEAAYVAQQTGLGGAAFEPTGIPASKTAVGDGSNFVSFVTYGDPVGNYASDTQGGTAFVSAHEPGASGEFNHYGHVVMIGNPADQPTVTSAYNSWNSALGSNILDAPTLLAGLARFHFPGTTAADLGVKLAPFSITTDTLVTPAVHVSPVANDTLAQLFASEAVQNARVAVPAS